jgi:hypothetical protein
VGVMDDLHGGVCQGDVDDQKQPWRVVTHVAGEVHCSAPASSERAQNQRGYGTFTSPQVGLQLLRSAIGTGATVCNSASAIMYSTKEITTTAAAKRANPGVLTVR